MPRLPAQRADLLLLDGTVYPQPGSRECAEAVAISRERILAAGTTRKIRRLAGPGAVTIDLAGSTVLPGFIDSHSHFMQDAAGRAAVDLSGTRTRAAALERIRRRHLRLPPDAWLAAVRWDESTWPDRRYLSRAELDRVAPSRKVLAFRLCGHLATASSAALQQLKLPRGLPGVEREPFTGRPTGILREQAGGRAAEALKITEVQCRRGLRAAIRQAHRLGITTFGDMGPPDYLATCQRALEERWLKIRIVFALPDTLLPAARSLGLRSGFGNRWLRVGPIKIFSDGAIGAKSAAMSGSFTDDPGNRGVFIHSRRELHRLIAEAHDAGFQLAVHAIGDRAIDAVLDGFEAALAAAPRQDARPRIEHFELATRSQIRRARRLGAIAAMQPNFVGQWGLANGMYDDRLGRERAETMNPFRWVLDEGMALAFGSDGMPYGPLYGLHWAVNAPYPAQRLKVEEALHAYTLGAARALFEETHLGSLEPGKLADLIVLDKDPYDVSDRLKELRVERAIIGGEEVFRRTRS